MWQTHIEEQKDNPKRRQRRRAAGSGGLPKRRASRSHAIFRTMRSMDEASQVQLVWDYLRKCDDLAPFAVEPADAILALGSSDIRVARHAAELMLRGLAKRLVCKRGSRR